jgi:sigma-B regulation protein RsbU (phosphoserine phosphatase)
MKIKTRILIQTLSASLALILVLGLVFFLSVAGIRRTVFANSNELGDSAADISGHALELRLTEMLNSVAQDMALILDERMSKIENHTRMTADITSSFYTASQSWAPKPLPRIRAGEIPPPRPYLYLAPGVDYSMIRAEAELAGNISEMLRQITVVDRGIATSAIGGESGYVIAMDVYPWPWADYDPKLYQWYQGAKDAGGLYWTDLYEDHRGRGPVITCAVPFYDQSRGNRIFKGVARSTVLLSDFSRIIESAKTGRVDRLFILDREGIMLYSSEGAALNTGEDGAITGDNFLESENPRQRSLGRSMTLGASGMTELEMDGIPVYVAYVPIQTLGWSLGIAVSVQEVSAMAMLIESQIWKIADKTKAGMDRYIFISVCLIAFLLGVTLIGIIFFAIRFTQSITVPILALNDGVREVAGGSLERAVTVRTGDELEQLASSFNMMTAQLRRHIEETARVTAERQRIDTELDIAMRIQMSMLPVAFPPYRGRKNEFDLYARVYPAREVGGDFYDFFFIDDDHFAMVIADVSGKGVPAALFMAIAKTIIKNRLQSEEDPELAMEIINRELCDNNIMDMFVTAWICVLEISSGLLVYINAGHNPPVVMRNGNDFSFLVSPPDLVLAGMDDTRYHSSRMRLNPGDILFLYTDGITEAANAKDEFYGKDRLKAFLDANAGKPLREMIDTFRDNIAAFVNGAEQSDDITMMALKMNSAAALGGSITLKADLEDLERLIAFIGKELDAACCPDRERAQIELAAEEVFVNIANYAYTDKETPGEALVECGIRPSPAGMTMTMIFSDKGRPFNPLDHPDPDTKAPLEERKVGGMGLLIVKKTMDTIYYSRENNVNRLEFSKSWQRHDSPGKARTVMERT